MAKPSSVIAVALAALVLASGTTAATTTEQGRWPAAVERSFVASCVRTSSGNRRLCTCALRLLERRYSATQIMAIFMHERQRFARIVVQVAYACR